MATALAPWRRKWQGGSWWGELRVSTQAPRPVATLASMSCSKIQYVVAKAFSFLLPRAAPCHTPGPRKAAPTAPDHPFLVYGSFFHLKGMFVQ